MIWLCRGEMLRISGSSLRVNALVATITHLGDDAATIGCHVMTIGRHRSNPFHAHARIQLNATLQRCADHAADIFERMIRSIAGDEPADEVGANVELLEDFPPRPELDALAVPGGEHNFLAHSLFFAVGVGEVDPSARSKIAI